MLGLGGLASVQCNRTLNGLDMERVWGGGLEGRMAGRGFLQQGRMPGLMSTLNLDLKQLRWNLKGNDAEATRLHGCRKRPGAAGRSNVARPQWLSSLHRWL